MDSNRATILYMIFGRELAYFVRMIELICKNISNCMSSDSCQTFSSVLSWYSWSKMVCNILYKFCESHKYSALERFHVHIPVWAKQKSAQPGFTDISIVKYGYDRKPAMLLSMGGVHEPWLTRKESHLIMVEIYIV